MAEFCIARGAICLAPVRKLDANVGFVDTGVDQASPAGSAIDVSEVVALCVTAACGMHSQRATQAMLSALTSFAANENVKGGTTTFNKGRPALRAAEILRTTHVLDRES